jgi:hypothetical protein
MFQKKLKKCLFTLNLNPDKYQEITDITYPLLKRYAHKIGAEFRVISERKFPEWRSPTYEKCQIYEMAQEMGNDWNLFFDADAMVHPDTMDLTSLVSKDTVLHNGADFAPIRWRSDRFFERDGRHIGSPSWCCMASDLCIELFKPLDDLTPEEAYENIFPIHNEVLAGYEPWRLIEDYVFSRNIAKYGLKFKTFTDRMVELKFGGDFFWHQYAMPVEEKVEHMKAQMKRWNLS